MSKNSKIIMWIVIIIVIVLLGWWYFASSSAPALPTNGANTAPLSQTTSQTSAAINGTTSAMGSDENSVPVAGLTTSPGDSSNAALNSDLSSIDTQQGGLANDSSNIDENSNTN